MELTREKTIKLHREMWGDMQKELGDTPKEIERYVFKRKWLEKRFYGHEIENDCFLCEFVSENRGDFNGDCSEICPIDWGAGCCFGKTKYDTSPISEILALPERKVE